MDSRYKFNENSDIYLYLDLYAISLVHNVFGYRTNAKSSDKGTTNN